MNETLIIYLGLRAYALRRVRDAFKENKSLMDSKTIKKEFLHGKENLELIKRQVKDFY